MPYHRRRALVPLAFALITTSAVVAYVLSDSAEAPLVLAPELPAVQAPPLPPSTDPIALPGQQTLRSERDAIAQRFATDVPDEERKTLARRAMEVQRAFLVNRPDPGEADLYKIRKGDTLGRIAGRYPTRKGLSGGILLLNGRRATDILQVGRLLRIPRGRWSILVDRSAFELYLCHRGAPFKSYRVAVGAGKSTPCTSFEVDDKVQKPMWWPPRSTGLRGPIPYGDPRNQLGEWWIGLQHKAHKGFGIHGTNAPDSLGTASSLGCVRMLNAEVAEVASVAHSGMAVRIVE